MKVQENKTIDIMNFFYELGDLADPRTSVWPLVGSPFPALATMLCYFLMCLVGPRLMKGRQPIHAPKALATYNLALVVLSAYMTYEFLMSALQADYHTKTCVEVDYSTSPSALRMASVCWLYYISKYIELIDTAFFIARQKLSQLTFLHVFHHGTMLFNWYMVTKFIAGGPAIFHAMVNSFVHVIMYTYYGLAALGPGVRPWLWWKRYVTYMQLAQFVAVMSHCAMYLLRCDYSRRQILYCGVFAGVMLCLFCNYYYQEFFVRARLRKVKAETADATETTDTTEVNGTEVVGSLVGAGDSSVATQSTPTNRQHGNTDVAARRRSSRNAAQPESEL